MTPTEMVLVLAELPDGRDLAPLLARHGGEALDHTSTVLLRLPEVGAALAFAREVHALPGARIAVHAAEVYVLPASAEAQAHGAKAWEIEGIAKPLVARLGALCPPGRTLLSGAARQRLPAELPLRDRGWWRLKGVDLPVQVWEDAVHDPLAPPILDHPKAAQVLRVGEAWVPAATLRVGLPAELDPLLGREEALDALEEILGAGARLLTLVGPGGMGKTRLGLRLAWRAVPAGGSWFTDLSQAATAEAIWGALARTHGVEPGRGALSEDVVRALRGRGPCLCVLDNAEQATLATRAVAETLLAGAPELRLILTSREPVGSNAERVYLVQSLDPRAGEALARLRARAAGAAADWDEAAAAEIRALVAEVDGLPLAIELAAARARALSPARLRERLSARFALLAAPRGANPRHVTLRAAIDGSWEALQEDERVAFARLAVMAGPFDQGAAEVVIGGEEPARLLWSLAQRSLVRPPAAEGEAWRLLANLQAYAAERLEERAARLDAEQAHGRHYARLGAPEALDALVEEQDAAGLRARIAGLDNLRAACARAVARGDAVVAAGTARAIWATMALPYADGLSLLDQALACGPLAPETRRALQKDRAEALRLLGRVAPAREALTEALAGATGAERALALAVYATQAGDRGELEEARAALEEALTLTEGRRARATLIRVQLAALLRQFDRVTEGLAVLDLAGEAQALPRPVRMSLLGERGALYHLQGRSEQAIACLQAAREDALRLGDGRRVVIFLLNLGVLQNGVGHLEAAEVSLSEALAGFRRLGDARGVGLALLQLGHCAQDRDATAVARVHLTEALGVLRESGLPIPVAITLGALGTCLQDEGDLAQAITSLEEGRALAERAGSGDLERLLCARLGRVLGLVGEVERSLAVFAEGRALLVGVADSYSLCLLLAYEAELLGRLGRQDAALASLAEARRHVSPRVTPGSEAAKALARAEAALG